MTRAANLAKIVTDANLEGTVDVAGAFTSQGIDDNADATAITISSGEDVGIGTASPNISSVGKALTINTTSSVILELAKNGSRVANFYSDGTNASLTNNTNNALTFLTNNSERMRIDNSGNVGIGTTSIAEPLRVQADSDTDFSASGAVFNNAIMLKNSTAGANNCVSLAMSTESNGEVYLSTVQNSSNNAADFVISTRASGARAERMRIDSSGNVGIGTAPLSKFHVDNTNSAFYIGYGGNEDIYLQTTNGNVLFTNKGATTERMRINSSGNVGIGTTSPASKMHLSGTQTVFLMERTGQSSGTGQFAMHMEGSNSNQITMVYDDGGKIVFGTASNPTNGAAFSEKMNLDSSGNLNIGATSFLVGSSLRNNNGMVARVDDNLNSRANIYFYAGVDHTGGLFCDFNTSSGGRIGSITRASSSSVAYNTSSDYRLKENVSYDFDATSRLKQLKPARFNWIADETNTLVDGFLAHEVSGIIPEAITGEKDATNEDGSIKPQGIDQSKLVPLLVKTIQELEARITILESA